MPIISPTAISPHRIGGAKDWSSYWATLISATVENAAPTHVVLTFPTAKTSLNDTDFTIAGFTINSASWAGAVLTLVLSEAVIVFDGDLIITFGKTSETATVTNNVADDGKTAAWYNSQDLTTITKDASERVSRWNDALGSGHDLLQSGADNLKPVWSVDGITFDGSNDSMVSGAFSLSNPMFFYGIIKQITWSNGRSFFEDRATNGLVKLCQYGTTPKIDLDAGAGPGGTLSNGNLAVNTYGVIRCLFYGANSKLIVDDTAATTGNPGAGQFTGLRVGSRADGLASFINATFVEMIFRKNNDSAAVEAAIYNYLKKKVI